MKCDKHVSKKGLNALIVYLNTLIGSGNIILANVIVVSVAVRHLLIQQIPFFTALEKVTNGLHLSIVCSKAILCENLPKCRGYLGYAFLLETQIIKCIKTNGF
jgi:hypothetical protein